MEAEEEQVVLAFQQQAGRQVVMELSEDKVE
jgi:hypothetical protein